MLSASAKSNSAIFCHRDMQEPFAGFVHEFGGTEFPRAIKITLHGFFLELDPQSPVQRIDGKSILVEGVVAVPHEIVFGQFEGHLAPFVTVRLQQDL